MGNTLERNSKKSFKPTAASSAVEWALYLADNDNKAWSLFGKIISERHQSAVRLFISLDRLGIRGRRFCTAFTKFAQEDIKKLESIVFNENEFISMAQCINEIYTVAIPVSKGISPLPADEVFV